MGLRGWAGLLHGPTVSLRDWESDRTYPCGCLRTKHGELVLCPLHDAQAKWVEYKLEVEAGRCSG